MKRRLGDMVRAMVAERVPQPSPHGGRPDSAPLTRAEEEELAQIQADELGLLNGDGSCAGDCCH